MAREVLKSPSPESSSSIRDIGEVVNGALYETLHQEFAGAEYLRSGLDQNEFYADYDLGESTISSHDLPLLTERMETYLKKAREENPSMREVGLDNFVLLSSSAVHVDSEESDRMVQRVRGAVFETKEEKEEYLRLLEEKKERSHILLGRKLELFVFSEDAPGMAYWLPKGLKIKNTLFDFWRQEHEQRGYQEVATPLLNKITLYKKSGHVDHYLENMFVANTKQGEWAAKPMNCPNAMFVYGLKERSYRELPLRISDCDTLHRLEDSGVLHGLLRVQEFQQDDAHLFVSPDQIEPEIKDVLEIVDRFYSVFGLEYGFRLGTRGDNYMGEIGDWNHAEDILTNVLMGQERPYVVSDGDAAFYGPKIDILMKDALGRQWQMGTIQLDFQLPKRFDLTYTDRDGSRKTPVLVHRVVYGSVERFIGIITEHFGGAFPTWISPEQVSVLPVTQEQANYASGITRLLKSQGVKATTTSEHDLNLSLGKRIRETSTQKIPYILVVGNREQEANSVSVRPRTWEKGQNMINMPVEEFNDRLINEISNKELDLQIVD